MLAYGLPIAVTLFIWWFSTGAILFLDGLPRQTFRWSMAATSLATLVALYGLSVSSHDTSVWGTYVAFGCAMMVWAWNEMAILMGFSQGHAMSPALQQHARLSAFHGPHRRSSITSWRS